MPLLRVQSFSLSLDGFIFLPAAVNRKDKPECEFVFLGACGKYSRNIISTASFSLIARSLRSASAQRINRSKDFVH